jgi:hypothetical protein
LFNGASFWRELFGGDFSELKNIQAPLDNLRLNLPVGLIT